MIIRIHDADGTTRYGKVFSRKPYINAEDKEKTLLIAKSINREKYEEDYIEDIDIVNVYDEYGEKVVWLSDSYRYNSGMPV